MKSLSPSVVPHKEKERRQGGVASAGNRYVTTVAKPLRRLQRSRFADPGKKAPWGKETEDPEDRNIDGAKDTQSTPNLEILVFYSQERHLFLLLYSSEVRNPLPQDSASEKSLIK